MLNFLCDCGYPARGWMNVADMALGLIGAFIVLRWAFRGLVQLSRLRGVPVE